MNSDRKKLMLGISTLLTAVLVSIFCISIATVCFHVYKTEGNLPFSRETVAAHAWYFMPQMILAAFAVITSGVISLILGKESVRLIAPKDEYKILKRITATAKKRSADGKLPVAAIGERKLRAIFSTAFATAALLASVFCLIFALDDSRYTLEDINGSVLKTVLVIFPIAIAVLAAGYVLDRFGRKSAVREASILKAFITDGASELSEVKECKAAVLLGRIATVLARPAVSYTIKGTVLAISLTFIIIGITNGGMSDVLGKAVRICTECIGLG